MHRSTWWAFTEKWLVCIYLLSHDGLTEQPFPSRSWTDHSCTANGFNSSAHEADVMFCKPKAYTESLYLTDDSCRQLPVPLPALEDAVRVQNKEGEAAHNWKDGVADCSAPAIPHLFLLNKDPTGPKTWPSCSGSPAKTDQETKLAGTRASQYLWQKGSLWPARGAEKLPREQRVTTSISRKGACQQAKLCNSKEKPQGRTC